MCSCSSARCMGSCKVRNLGHGCLTQDVHRIIFPHSSANTSSLGEFVRWECRHLLQDEDKSVCDEDERDWYRQCTSEYPAVQTRFDASQCSESGDSGYVTHSIIYVLRLYHQLRFHTQREARLDTDTNMLTSRHERFWNKISWSHFVFGTPASPSEEIALGHA